MGGNLEQKNFGESRKFRMNFDFQEKCSRNFENLGGVVFESL